MTISQIVEKKFKRTKDKSLLFASDFPEYDQVLMSGLAVESYASITADGWPRLSKFLSIKTPKKCA